MAIKYVLASTGLITILMFLYNRYKEKRHLKIACLILLIEINRHMTWLEVLSKNLSENDRKNALDVISTADFVNSDWNKIKFEDMFHRIPVENFNLIALHYDEMFSFQKAVEKCFQRNEKIEDQRFAIEHIDTCKLVYNIIYKLAGKPKGFQFTKI